MWIVCGLALLGLLPFTMSAADLDIRQFGANCDGRDDALAVQGALNALSDGDRLAFPCLAYIGPAGLRLSRRTGVVIEGVNGGGMAAIGANAEHLLLAVEYCDQCTIRYLTIDGRNAPAAGISINYSKGARIEGNSIYNIGYPASAGILGLGNHGNVYTWNTVNTTGLSEVNGAIVDGTRGIWLGNPSPQWIEYDAVITNNKLINTGWTGIAVNGAGATVSGNYVEGTYGSGIKIEQPSNTGGRSLVQWNTCVRNRFSGVQVQNGYSAVLVHGNVLEDNLIAGVYTAGAFAGGEIAGNRITGSGEAGIYVYNASGALIEDNQIVGGKSGIAFEVLQTDKIQDLRLHSNDVGGISGNGLVMLGHGGSMQRVTLDSNNFQNIKQYGLAIDENSPGAINGPSLIANCFANIGLSTLFDTRSSGALKAPAVASSCPKPPQSRFRPIRINAGGGTYVDDHKQLWQADNNLIPGNAYRIDVPIWKTPVPELYRNGRWTEGPLTFSVDVPNRVYTVTLRFAEPAFQKPGQRIFDIYINNELVLPNFDILAYADPFEAVDRSFRVTVTTGQVAIRLAPKVDNPLINAIEIQ